MRTETRAALATTMAIAGGILLAHVVTATWAQVQTFGLVVLAGVFVGVAMEPGVNALHRRGVRRGLAAWFIIFLAFCILGGLVATFGAVGISQGVALIDRLPSLAADLQDRLAAWGIEVDLVSLVENRDQLSTMTVGLQDRVMEISTTAALAFGKLLAVAFVAFWVAVEGTHLRHTLARVVAPSRRAHIERVWEIAVERTGGYLYSRVILSLTASICCSVGFTLVGSEYAIPLGVWAGVVSTIVPLVGSWMGGGLPVLIALGADPARALWVLGVFLAYQQLKNWFIGPRVMRHAVKLHPLAGFSAVVVGASLAGATGALLAVPLVATVQGVVAAQREGALGAPESDPPEETGSPTSADDVSS